MPTAADHKTHAAYHRAMKNIFRNRQLGESRRCEEPHRGREHDKPAMLGTDHSASDTPGNAEDDIRFDYELSDPLSVYGRVLVIAVALVLLGIVAAAMFILF
jgi:hypothetical protein